MRSMISNIKTKLFALCLCVIVISCDDDGYADYKQGSSPSQAMNGEWWIDITDATTGEVYVQHAFHKTYDDNNGGMWISDRSGSSFTGWYLESIVNVNNSNLTFSATDAANLADDSEVTITEGKVLKNAGHSKTGVVVDSIYFKGVFNYDPSTTLIFAGHKRTGFEEDEY